MEVTGLPEDINPADVLLDGPGARVLTVRFTGAAAAVAVAVTEHPDGSGNVVCLTVGYPRQITTMLPVPLGARVIVDAVSRMAVAATASHPAG